jgi:hypothetical protein
VLTGTGATAVMDAWSWARQRAFGVAPPDYGLVGRWIGHLRHGRIHHDSIARAAPVRGERALGWITHYLVGIGFASLLPIIFGQSWLHRPTLAPALLIGLGTVAAPFLVMQPAMGAGFAASRTPRPGAARLQSLLNHAVFGLGLYLSAVMGTLPIC